MKYVQYSSSFLVLNYQKVVGDSIKVVLYSSSKKVEVLYIQYIPAMKKYY